MAIYKRKETWYIRFESNGQTVHCSAKTTVKKEAQQLHDKLKSDVWKQIKIGVKPKMSWRDAVVRYMDGNTRKHQQNDVLAIKWLDKYLGKMMLHDITRDIMQMLLAEKKNEGVKNSTANRTVAFVRVVLNKAMKEWGWLDTVPHITFLKEPRRRVRFLTRDEADTLIGNLPHHLALMARFSLATGLRASNVTGLEWSQVDLTNRKAWIYGDQAKAGKSIPVPLNNDAVLVLREGVGGHDKFVFTYRGKPVKRTSASAWRKALIRSGIDDFRWHDLRHTWASWHIQNGTPINVLMELGGWSDLEMVQKYAHFNPDHLADYAGNVSKIRTIRAKSAQR